MHWGNGTRGNKPRVVRFRYRASSVIVTDSLHRVASCSLGASFAFLVGHDVVVAQRRGQPRVGLCPRFSLLAGLLTVAWRNNTGAGSSAEQQAEGAGPQLGFSLLAF